MQFCNINCLIIQIPEIKYQNIYGRCYDGLIFMQIFADKARELKKMLTDALKPL